MNWYFINLNTLTIGLIFGLVFLIFLVFLITQGNKKFLSFISSSYKKKVAVLLKVQWLRLTLLVLVGVFLLLSLGRPRSPELEALSDQVERRGVEAVILADVSTSMLAEDIKPSRLHLMKSYLLKFLESGWLSQVSLLSFSGVADLISPLTFDLMALSSFVETLEVDHMIFQGTNLSKALKLAKKSLDKGINGGLADRILIIFSDGEDHSVDALNLVSQYAKEGLIVYSVAVGTQEGGLIPSRRGNSYYLKDKSGNRVTTRPNFDFLKQLAKLGNGKFYKATYLVDQVLEQISNDLKKKQQGSGKVAYGRYMSFDEHYRWPLFIALLFLILEMSLSLFVFRKKSFMLGILFVMSISSQLSFASEIKRGQPIGTLDAFRSEKILKNLNKDNIKTATQIYKELLEKNPLNLSLYYNLGILMLSSADLEGAYGQFQFLLEKAKTDQEKKLILMPFAFIKWKSKNINGALKDYQSLLNLSLTDEEYNQVHTNIELMMKEQGNNGGDSGNGKDKNKEKKKYSNKAKNEEKKMNDEELKYFMKKISQKDAQIRKKNIENEKRKDKKSEENSEKPW